MNTNNGHIACECQNAYIPVDFYGDVLCDAGPLPHVREIIKIYEPEQQQPHQAHDLQRSSGDNCPMEQLQPQAPQSHIQYQHMIYEERQVPQFMLCSSQPPQPCGLLISPPPQPINIENSPKRFVDHENDQKNILRVPESSMPLVIEQTNEEIIENSPPESDATKIESNVELDESKIYRSRTTIINTKTGVKIITDISYDSLYKTDSDYAGVNYDNGTWAGRRIETVIPPSKILNNFDEKVNQGCYD